MNAVLSVVSAHYAALDDRSGKHTSNLKCRESRIIARAIVSLLRSFQVREAIRLAVESIRDDPAPLAWMLIRTDRGS